MREKVVSTLSESRIFGISNAQTFNVKKEFLEVASKSRDKVAIIVCDPIRSSSTLTALFAAGARGVIPVPKSEEPTGFFEKAQQYFHTKGVEVVKGGELFGRPIFHNGISNSPRSVASLKEVIEGKIIYFYCSNLGSSFSSIVNFISETKVLIDCYMMSYYNLNSVVEKLKREEPSLISIVSGGFYKTIASEDFLLSGALINKLCFPFEQLDDEALMMDLAYKGANQNGNLSQYIQSNAISSWLRKLGKQDDISACLDASMLHYSLTELVESIVPTLNWDDQIPYFVKS